MNNVVFAKIAIAQDNAKLIYLANIISIKNAFQNGYLDIIHVLCAEKQFE